MSPDDRGTKRGAPRATQQGSPGERPPASERKQSGLFLDDLLRRFQDMQSNAGWKAVFGDVIQVDGRRIIPVASVQYGFGMGGGQGSPEAGGTPGGGGGGGGMRAEPVAFIEISDGRLRIEPIVNVTKLAVAAMLLAGWSVFWIARTLRAGSRRT